MLSLALVAVMVLASGVTAYAAHAVHEEHVKLGHIVGHQIDHDTIMAALSPTHMSCSATSMLLARKTMEMQGAMFTSVLKLLPWLKAMANWLSPR